MAIARSVSVSSLLRKVLNLNCPLQSSRASTVTDSPATSSSWADSGLPASEHRVGKRIAELQQHTQQQDHHSEATHSESERDPLSAAGTMLLSEVDLGGGRGDSGGSAEPLPSSEVLLTDGRTVSVTGNVSPHYAFHCWTLQMLLDARLVI